MNTELIENFPANHKAGFISIIGKPNVGKSTLMNQLVGERLSIITSKAQTTRHRIMGILNGVHNGQEFQIVYSDTPGIIKPQYKLHESMMSFVRGSIEDADVILFVTDIFEQHDENDVVTRLQKSDVPILLLINKIDQATHEQVQEKIAYWQQNFKAQEIIPISALNGFNIDQVFEAIINRLPQHPPYFPKAETTERSQAAAEFYGLGLGDPYPISSMTGSGTGDLLDEVVKHFQIDGVADPEAGLPRIAILGRPNVGKSSFLNVLTGQDRSIVTDIAGTTRDAINTRYKAYGKDFILTDTAGIRRKARIQDNIEFYSTLRSLKAMEESDVCIIMLDATRGLEAQDLHIIGQAAKAKKGMVIMVNKWDAVEKDQRTADVLRKEMIQRMMPIDYVPIIFASVHEKQRIFQVMEKAMEVYENKAKKIATSKLNEAMQPEIEAYPPPSMKSKQIKIKYMLQLPTPAPTFVFFCNLPQYVQESYQRFLENKIRSHFDFTGVPITLFFRQK